MLLRRAVCTAARRRCIALGEYVPPPPLSTASTALNIATACGAWWQLSRVGSAGWTHRQLHASAAAAIIRHFSRPKPKDSLAPPTADANARKVNEAITAGTVRVVLDDSTHQVLDRAAALALAKSQGKDLLQVDPHGDPPVCRLVDISKVKAADRAKEKAAKRKEVERRHADVTKDVRFTLRTASHDLQVKAAQAARWLMEGHRARVCITLKHAREAAESGAKPAAEALVRQVIDAINEELKVQQAAGQASDSPALMARQEAPPKLEALTMSCRLLPLDTSKLPKQKSGGGEVAAPKKNKVQDNDAATVLVLSGQQAVSMARTAAAGVGHGDNDAAITNTDS